MASEIVPQRTDKPKLLDRVRAEIRARRYSPRTEEAYLHWVERFIRNRALALNVR